MASRVYQCQLSMAKDHEIINQKSPDKSNVKDGRTKLLFHKIETKFMLRTKQPELEGVSAADVFIDSETFEDRDKETGMSMLAQVIWWMTREEALGFLRSALAFARQMVARPGNANLKQIPVVVDFWVYTVQQENESYEEAMKRAIRARNCAPPSDATKLAGHHDCRFMPSPQSFA